MVLEADPFLRRGKGKHIRFTEPLVKIELGEFPSRQVGEILTRESLLLSREVRGILKAAAQVVDGRFLDGEIGSEHIWDVILRRHEPTKEAVKELKYNPDDIAGELERQITTGRRQKPWVIEHPNDSLSTYVVLTPTQSARLVTPEVELALDIAQGIVQQEAKAARIKNEEKVTTIVTAEHLLIGLFLSGVARGVNPGLLFLTTKGITFEKFLEAYAQQKNAEKGQELEKEPLI